MFQSVKSPSLSHIMHRVSLLKATFDLRREEVRLRLDSYWKQLRSRLSNELCLRRSFCLAEGLS